MNKTIHREANWLEPFRIEDDGKVALLYCKDKNSPKWGPEYNVMGKDNAGKFHYNEICMYRGNTGMQVHIFKNKIEIT